MDIYDPLTAPEPKDWLALDESTRVQLVLDYHELDDDAEDDGDEFDEKEADRSMLHAVIHAVIENQLALEVAAVRDAMRRLLEEGLDRHEALHAIGSVLARSLFEMLREEDLSPEAERAYHDALGELTAEGWRSAR